MPLYRPNRRAVYRYPVHLNDDLQSIDMPNDARIVHVGIKGDDPDTVNLWAEVRIDENNMIRAGAKTETRSFRVFGTGHPIQNPTDGRKYEYVGTAIMDNPSFVWHVYELKA